ncbi:hypothetical protein V5E97_25315 [Singulisphaera sp. Ch08]|uniref:Uncharacterized protein n=1 Tax=Singulisphaera sp. Ch08 TaxID=3120278 RepID=A0AAU7C959_9BACT
MDAHLDALLAAFVRFKESEPIDLVASLRDYLSPVRYRRHGTRGL